MIRQTSALKSRPVHCALCGTGPQHHRFLIRAHINTPQWPGDRLCRIVICRRCTLAFVSPRLEPEGYVRYYASSNYRLDDEGAPVAAAGGEQRRRKAENIVDFCGRFIREDRSNLAVVDVGCGFGDVLAVLQERWRSQVTGVEISAAAVEYARSTYRLDILQQNVEGLLLPSKAFDLVILSAVLEHTMDPLAVLAQARLALKDGGLMFVRVPDLSRIGLRIRKGDLVQRVFKPVHTYYFTPATLTIAARAAGLVPVAVERRSADLRQGEIWSLYRQSAAVEREGLSENWWKTAATVWKRSIAAWMASELLQVGMNLLGERRARRLLQRISG